MLHPEIAAIRKTYATQILLEENASSNPFDQFSRWWKDAVKAEIDEVNAMTLATCSKEGIPDARVVLLKDYSPEGFIFFTNYESNKGKQLTDNPYATLVFFWKELERQVRIKGTVTKTAATDSDAYFNSRPEGSRIGAITSPQSRVIETRAWIDDAYEINKQQLQNTFITRPENWGGFIVKPFAIEFWQGRPSRLHDRLQYTFIDNTWKRTRLAP